MEDLIDIISYYDFNVKGKFSVNEHIYFPSTLYLLQNYKSERMGSGNLICASLLTGRDITYSVKPNVAKVLYFRENGPDYKKMWPEKYDAIKRDYDAIKLARLHYQIPFLFLESENVRFEAVEKQDKYLELASQLSCEIFADLKKDYSKLSSTLRC